VGEWLVGGVAENIWLLVLRVLRDLVLVLVEAEGVSALVSLQPSM